MATIVIDKNIMVPMRDGVRLATDVYRLQDAPPAPVLLARTPYDKERGVAGSVPFDIMRAVQSGYAVVVQDVRGRFASEGTFNAHSQEARDGVDAITWAAAQPWASGVVGTLGGSYLGGTQWLPAREQPPALRAMAPTNTASDMYEGLTYQGGAKVLHDMRWAVTISRDESRRRAARGWVPLEGIADFDADAAVAHLPLDDHPLFRELAPFYLEWLAHPTADAYWPRCRPVPATSGSLLRRSTSAGGTTSSCGVRFRTTWACGIGAATTTGAATSA